MTTSECMANGCRCADPGDIVDLVQADLAVRKRVGMERYGLPLRASEGGPEDHRDFLWEAYEEGLDLVIYLRKEIARRASRGGVHAQ